MSAQFLVFELIEKIALETISIQLDHFRDPTPALCRMSHVCQHWRSSVYGTNVLLDYLDYNRCDGRSDLIAERHSKGARAKVAYIPSPKAYYTKVTAIQKFNQPLFAHINSATPTTYIRIASPACWRAVKGEVKRLAPFVEECWVSNVDDSVTRELVSMILSCSGNVNALRIDNHRGAIHIPFPERVTVPKPSLTVLKIQTRRINWRPIDLVWVEFSTLLRHSSATLKILSLRGVQFDFVAGGQMALPLMSDLACEGDARCCTTFLPQLQLPISCKLSICIRDVDFMQRDCRQMLQRMNLWLHRTLDGRKGVFGSVLDLMITQGRLLASDCFNNGALFYDINFGGGCLTQFGGGGVAMYSEINTLFQPFFSTIRILHLTLDDASWCSKSFHPGLLEALGSVEHLIIHHDQTFSELETHLFSRPSRHLLPNLTTLSILGVDLTHRDNLDECEDSEQWCSLRKILPFLFLRKNIQVIVSGCEGLDELAAGIVSEQPWAQSNNPFRHIRS